MDVDKSDVRQIKTQLNLMEDVTWSVIDDERKHNREDEDIGAPSDSGMERLDIMDDHIVYTMSYREIVPGLVQDDENLSYNDVMREGSIDADRYVKDGVLDLVLSLKVRDGSFRVFHTDEVHFDNEEVEFILS